MLKRYAKNQTEMIDIVTMVEALGFSYTVEASRFPEGYNYAITLLEDQPEAGAAQEAAQEAGRYKVGRTVNRRTSERVAGDNAAISEFLRGRAGRRTTAQQIREAMQLRGITWNPNSTTGIILIAIKADPNIVNLGSGFYEYREREAE